MSQIQDFGTLFSLKGKVAVVTGGSRGLGLHAATGLLLAGCDTVYISSRKADACQKAADDLNAIAKKEGLSGKAIPIAADLSKAKECERLYEEVKKSTDKVHILLANAGAAWGAPLDEHQDEHFAKVMDLNVRGVFNTIKYFIPLLEAAGSLEDPARVITTGSMVGIGIGAVGKTGTWSYTASKSAVMHMTKHISVELGPRGILCNSIAPGYFPSKMADGMISISGGQDRLSGLSPNKRLGKPEDIVGVVVYLCSRAGSHINGAIIPLDGGMVISRSTLGEEAVVAEPGKTAKL